MTIKKIATEYQECEAFFDWISHNPRLAKVSWHIANERNANVVEIMRLNKIGMKKGALDYVIFIANKKYHGLVIEMKISDKKKARVTTEQFANIENLKTENYYSCVCYGCDEAIEIVNKYLKNEL